MMPDRRAKCGTRECVRSARDLPVDFDDQAMLDGIKELIEQAKAQKAALHPEKTP